MDKPLKESNFLFHTMFFMILSHHLTHKPFILSSMETIKVCKII